MAKMINAKKSDLFNILWKFATLFKICIEYGQINTTKNVINVFFKHPTVQGINIDNNRLLAKFYSYTSGQTHPRGKIFGKNKAAPQSCSLFVINLYF